MVKSTFILFAFLFSLRCFAQIKPSEINLALLKSQTNKIDSLCDKEGRIKIKFRSKKAQLNYYSSKDPRVLHTIKINYHRGFCDKTEIYICNPGIIRLSYINDQLVLILWKKWSELGTDEEIKMTRLDDSTLLWTYERGKDGKIITIREKLIK